MSDFTQTPNLSLFKPTYDADAEQWGNHLNANADTLDAVLGTSGPSALFLPLAGGTMTGGITLPFDPSTALGAATKQYVDAHSFTDAPSNANAYGRLGGAWVPVVPIAGATMTGPLTLSGDPSATLQAATKNYVDTHTIGTFLPLVGGTVTGPTTFNTIGFNNTAPIARPTVSGAKGSNAALASLMTALAAYGLVTDTTTA